MKKENSIEIHPLLKDSYLSAIQNSIGSNLFQNFYAKIDGQKKDLMQGGALSCAFFVSSLTTLFGLSSRVHGTVDGLLKDLTESGWKKIHEPMPGAIILWKEMDFEGEKHKHIGFYVGEGRAVSNSTAKRVPVKHEWTFEGEREVVGVYWNERLG